MAGPWLSVTVADGMMCGTVWLAETAHVLHSSLHFSVKVGSERGRCSTLISLCGPREFLGLRD